jgi:hypothetical protein
MIGRTISHYEVIEKLPITPVVFPNAPAALHAGSLPELPKRRLIQPLLGGKRPIVEAKPT